MSRVSPARKVSIVGAGPGGLATAVILAARGVDVTVHEAAPEIGGRTGRVRLGDYAFDRGPTFFLMPHVLQEILDHAGRRLEDEIELVPLDPMYRLVIGRRDEPDVVLDASRDVEEMARRIGSVHEPDGPRFLEFVERNRRKLAAFEPILRRSIRSPLDLVRLHTLRAAPLLTPWRSVHDETGRFFDHPANRLAVGFQSKYLGMAPGDCPSLFTILPFIEYEYGVWHPVGGCHAVMRMLARVARELGADVRTSEPVREIRFDGRRAVGVRVESDAGLRDVACDHVVLNADASWALRNLVPERLRRGWRDRDLDAKSYSCSTWMMYLGVEGEVDLPHHVIRTAPDYERNLHDIGRAGCVSEDPSFYVCNAARTDPDLAPPGHAALYVLVPVPNTKADIDWDAETPRLRQRVLNRMRDVLGVDLAGRIRAERVVTPDDWEATNIAFGATFNLAHDFDQLLHRRPQHRLPGCEGVWLVGGGTHPGSGLPVIFLSSGITARMLLRRVGLPAAGPPPVAMPARRHEPGVAAPRSPGRDRSRVAAPRRASTSRSSSRASVASSK